MNMFMCLRVNMGKFEVQIEGCMGYITFWDNLSSNGLCRPTKALYEDFHLTSNRRMHGLYNILG